MGEPYPGYDDVVRESHEIAEAHPDLATYSEIGKSEEGRPMPLLTITDPAVPTEDKSVFLLSGGTDGSEEVGRAVALGMARALLQPASRVHLERQVVLIVPVTNPDGCVRDQADKLGNANGVPAAEVHRPGEPPTTAEGRAMRALVAEWIPDAHVDFHGLAGGSMGDCSFLYPTVDGKRSIPIEGSALTYNVPANRPTSAFLGGNHVTRCVLNPVALMPSWDGTVVAPPPRFPGTGARAHASRTQHAPRIWLYFSPPRRRGVRRGPAAGGSRTRE